MGLVGNISQAGCLPYSARYVITFALYAPLGMVSEKNRHHARVDYKALMDLYDIYEADVRPHPSYAPL